MDHLYLALRFAKLLAVAALFTGTIGAFVARDLADRRRFAYFMAGPAMGATWASGFGLAEVLSARILTTWAIGSIVLSLFSLQVVLFAVGKEGRRGAISASLAVLPLIGATALMVWRPE